MAKEKEEIMPEKKIEPEVIKQTVRNPETGELETKIKKGESK